MHRSTGRSCTPRTHSCRHSRGSTSLVRMRKRKSSVPAPRSGPSPATVWVALVVLNLFIYAAVRDFQLVNWDDPTYITENPTVLSGLSWSRSEEHTSELQS